MNNSKTEKMVNFIFVLVFVGMIMIGIVGLLFDTILHWLEVKVAKGMNAE